MTGYQRQALFLFRARVGLKERRASVDFCARIASFFIDFLVLFHQGKTNISPYWGL